MTGYRLLDSGDFRKLEQVGPLCLIRPALQAVWEPRLDGDTWQKAAAEFQRDTSGFGKWSSPSPQGREWALAVHGLHLKLRLTDFGHIGFFPEHAVHLEWMETMLSRCRPPPRVLNLFAYTGLATLGAARSGASVCHVDAVKSIVSWARDNARQSGLDKAPIRWIVEDAARFVDRAVKRGERFDAVILDPPSFGRGPNKEQWKIETCLMPLLKKISGLFSEDFRLFLLSSHTPGYTPLALQNLLQPFFPSGILESGEMVIPEGDGSRVLPSGAYARWTRPE